MAGFRFSRRDESQVDPFTAGEPELPGGEPETLGDYASDLPADDPGQADYAPHGDPTGTPHKPDDNYRAPVTRERDYDAPSTDGPRGTRGRRGGRASAARRDRRIDIGAGAPSPSDDVQRRTEKDRHLVTRVIVLLVLLVSFGSSVVSCAAGFLDAAGESAAEVVEGLGDALFGDGSTSDDYDDYDAYVPEQDESEMAATEALQERLGQIVSAPGQGPTYEQVKTYFEQKVLDVEGRGVEELGVDSGTFARMVTNSLHLSAEYAYDWGDGTATAYASVTSIDANELFWAFYDAASDYLLEHDLWGADVISPTDEQRTYMNDALNAALEEVSAETETSSYGFDLELVDDEWVVDEEGLAETMEMALSLY